jgi:hypothetical protein
LTYFDIYEQRSSWVSGTNQHLFWIQLSHYVFHSRSHVSRIRILTFIRIDWSSHELMRQTSFNPVREWITGFLLLARYFTDKSFYSSSQFSNLAVNNGR